MIPSKLTTTIIALGVAASVAHAGPTLPAHYATLFDPTATWTYDVTRGADKPVTITCKVARTIKHGSIRASEVTCDGAFGDDLPIANVYLARGDGLYTSGVGFPETRDEIGDFSMHMLVIAAKPKPTKRTVRRFAIVDQTPVPVDTIFETKRDKAAWCWARTTKHASSTSVDSRCFTGRLDYGVERDLVFRAR